MQASPLTALFPALGSPRPTPFVQFGHRSHGKQPLPVHEDETAIASSSSSHPISGSSSSEPEPANHDVFLATNPPPRLPSPPSWMMLAMPSAMLEEDDQSLPGTTEHQAFLQRLKESVRLVLNPSEPIETQVKPTFLATPTQDTFTLFTTSPPPLPLSIITPTQPPPTRPWANTIAGLLSLVCFAGSMTGLIMNILKNHSSSYILGMLLPILGMAAGIVGLVTSQQSHQSTHPPTLPLATITPLPTSGLRPVRYSDTAFPPDGASSPSDRSVDLPDDVP